MEKNENDEKNNKFIIIIKNKKLKGYEKTRNKIYNNFEPTDILQRFSYDKENNTNYLYDKLTKEYNYSPETRNFIDKFKKNNNKNFNNISVQNLSKIKNKNLNNLFCTKQTILNQSIFKNKQLKLSLNNNKNVKDSQSDVKAKKNILNKLFPDINEINKYSNLPFFSLVKTKYPYKMRLNLSNKKEGKKKFPQEEFLYQISHNNNDEEKINYNFIKNKSVKKGITKKYFHGVDKYCINNKISENNFITKENLNKKKFKLELDINNLTKGEKIPQISTKEKHIRILEKNLKNIKTIPNQLMNDLEDDIFNFIDNEFDSINEESKYYKKEEYKNAINIEQANDNDTNCINLNKQFNTNNINNTSISDKNLQTSIDYLNYSKNKSYFNNTNNNNFKSTVLKKPNKYPINFYSTQQLKIKEHFNKNHKNTFDERNKKFKKGYNSERNLKKKLPDEMIENIKGLQKRKIINYGNFFKKECKIRDILIGNKLKCEFTPIDIKRILNGLKPYADINLEGENDNTIEINQLNDNMKDKENKKNKLI